MLDQLSAAASNMIGVALASLLLIIAVIDQLSFGQLVIFTLVFRTLSDRLYPRQAPRAVTCTSAIISLLYFGHRAVRDSEDVAALCVTTTRTYLAFWLVFSIILPVTIVLQCLAPSLRNWLAESIGRLMSILAIPFKAMFKHFRRMPLQPVPAPTSPPSPPRQLSKAERMAILASAARSEYDAEVAVLSTLPLDEDEQEVLMLQAKQRLLLKLSKLPEA